MSLIADLILQLQNVNAELESIQADFSGALAAEREAGKADRDAEVADLKALAVSEYERGVADGKASVPPSGDKLYSQAELDEAISLAVSPLNEQVLALQGQVSALQGSLDGVPAQIAQAVADLKASLLASYDEAQLAESSVETNFRNSLTA